MNGVLEYKGYFGTVEYSANDSLLYGKVLNATGLISYEGDSVASLRADFEGAVEDYLELCSASGIEPEKPYKGTFNVRIKPELHRRAVLRAAAEGETLNGLVEHAIERYVG